MNAHHFQQVRTDIRHVIGRYGLALGLGLALLVAALTAQRYAAPRTTPSDSQPFAAPVANQGWPGATLMGSAYDGQSAHPVRPVRHAIQGWPGATLMGSAYDGQ
jgi:hypothetical protein